MYFQVFGSMITSGVCQLYYIWVELQKPYMYFQVFGSIITMIELYKIQIRVDTPPNFDGSIIC